MTEQAVEGASEENPAITALRATHGSRLLVFETMAGTVAFRKPNRLEWRQYTSEAKDDSLKAVADERFCAKLVVFPDPATFSALSDEYPALHIPLSVAICEASGMKKLEAKKL